ncbi:THAP domain-containing protein 11-like [Lytechinus variegatus]|uniref:THAP domain-containing protein 11-like n=1 Tax=Lytechinus variegatus TaxID=7654 RepID=UPI001BB21837|nr:THAP domain-containing protein 11-like [Lytechinus variegatus]
MVNFCCVTGCSNRSNRERDLSFYCIPTVLHHQGEHSHKLSKQRREKWLSNIKRIGWEPAKHSRVCSVHFISGKPSFLHCVDHPDWAPTQRMGYTTSNASSPLQQGKQTKQRKRKADDISAASALIELRQNSQPAADDKQRHEEHDTNRVNRGCQTDMSSQDVSMIHERYKQIEQDNIALRTEVLDLREKVKSLQHSRKPGRAKLRVVFRHKNKMSTARRTNLCVSDPGAQGVS